MHAAESVRFGLILDDHPLVARGIALVARGIAEYLQSLPPFLPMRVVTNAELMFGLIDRHGPPDIALIDYWLAEGAADSVIERLRVRCPACALLVISGDGDPLVAQRAMSKGARGFLHKQQQPEVFGRAVATLLAGGRWEQEMSPAVPARGPAGAWSAMPACCPRSRAARSPRAPAVGVHGQGARHRHAGSTGCAHQGGSDHTAARA